jgi:hypothetical protein
MKTNLMRHLSLIYFIKQPLYISGIFIVHQLPGTKTYNTHQLLCIYSEYLLMMCNKYARNIERLFDELN